MLHTIREIAFIGSEIPEGQTLIAGIKKGIETAILDPNRDAIAQMGETLKGKKYSAIHIICHGAPGHLQLGNTALNIETLPQYTFEIQQWRESLTAEASILLYGCNVAQSVGAGSPTDLRIIDNSNKPAPTPPCGNQFLTQLHQLTGAFIVANPNPTGHPEPGRSRTLPPSIPPPPRPPMPDPPPPTHRGFHRRQPQPHGQPRTRRDLETHFMHPPIPHTTQTRPHRNRPQNLQRHPGFSPQSRLPHWGWPQISQHRRLQRRRETRCSCGEP